MSVTEIRPGQEAESVAEPMLTKLPVYGIELGNLVIRPDAPWEYHRGRPGAGFTHSLMFAVVLGLLPGGLPPQSQFLAVLASRHHRLGRIVGHGPELPS